MREGHLGMQAPSSWSLEKKECVVFFFNLDSSAALQCDLQQDLLYQVLQQNVECNILYIYRLVHKGWALLCTEQAKLLS